MYSGKITSKDVNEKLIIPLHILFGFNHEYKICSRMIVKRKHVHKKPGRKNLLFTPESATTAALNYSDDLKILGVTYRDNNRVYNYLNVPVGVWEEYKELIQSGGSSGKFVNTRIKPFYKAVEIEKIKRSLQRRDRSLSKGNNLSYL